MKKLFPFLLAIMCAMPALEAQAPAASPLAPEIDRRAAAIQQDLLTWRRHLHQHPELSNQETETAGFIAEKLRSFGLEPQTRVARTGVTRC
jgi:amidohydrolase